MKLKPSSSYAVLLLVALSTITNAIATDSTRTGSLNPHHRLSKPPLTAATAFHRIPRGGGTRGKTITKSSSTSASTPARNDEDTNTKFRLSGDIGNLLTIVLSMILLFKTPFNVKDCGLGGCDAFYDNGEVYSGNLDPCYVCDGFCIANADNPLTNSHMLSLYADIAMFIPLILFKQNKREELDSMHLGEYYISDLKVNSVLGHGVAHMSLSLLERFGKQKRILNGSLAKQLVSLGILLARFYHPNTPLQFRAFLDRIQGTTPANNNDPQNTKASEKAHRNGFLRSAVAPFLTGISLAQLTDAPVTPGLINYAIFGLTCYVFFEAGIPPAEYSWVFSIIMSAVATYLSVGVIGVQNVQQSFVIVFTSSYLVSALYQIFIWGKEAKNENAKAYAVSAWASNIFTTLVGWALALKCSQLKNIGGHVLYDASISISYFLIYYLTKKMM